MQMPDYSKFDKNPDLVSLIFYPRGSTDPCPSYASDSMIPVEDGIFVSCRLFSMEPSNPWILYFHGNGEIAGDYDEIAPYYLQRKINLAVADYRGYGQSSGSPSLTGMLKDCQAVFSSVRKEISRRGYAGKLWLMGRSLGSLSTLELAASHPGKINGIILESGFTSVIPVWRNFFLFLLPDKGLLEKIEREALALVGSITLPALVIHGEQDTIVPLSEARTLYESLGSPEKQILLIPDADHNTIIFAHPQLYFSAISEFIRQTA